MDYKFFHFSDSSFEQMIKDLEKYNKEREEKIDCLIKENERLRSENYKDEELAKMQKEITWTKDILERDQKAMRLGFPISEEEDAAINKWYKEHKEKEHGGKYYGGAIGGSISYKFIPTSIGTVGVCSCDACRCRAIEYALDKNPKTEKEFRDIVKENMKERSGEFTFQDLY